MPTVFPRSVGTLGLERPHRRLAVLALSTLLLAGWALWFFGSSLAVYAVSDDARVEVDGAPYPVEAPAAGRVVSSFLNVGRSVRAGETLVDLDVRQQLFEVNEERVRIEGLAPQAGRVTAEIAEQKRSRTSEQAAAAAARAQAQAQYEEAAAAAELAADTERRDTRLAADGLIGQADLLRAQSITKQRHAAAEALRLAVGRVDAEQQYRDAEHQVKIERLAREAASLRAQILTGAAVVERLQHEGEVRRIVAPIAGILAEVAPIRPGGVLQAGDTVATVVPSGALRIVALFMPAEALGRIRPGQPARLRLEGFPATQYGTVPTTVSTVASEVRDGRVRVELSLAGLPTTAPLQHGLPGKVEVEIEQVSPATLALRGAGRKIDAPQRDGRRSGRR